MTLAKRLSGVDRRQDAIEDRVAALEQTLSALLDAVEEEETEEPVLSLDGDELPGERDQDQPL